MLVAVRPASLDLDRERIVKAIQQFLTPASDGRRFDWLYLSNPHGKARVWVAEDLHRHETVGVAAIFPRRMYVDGILTFAGVLGDFCIHPEYRVLGPALQLQRACLAEVDSGRMEFCYDFPSVSMSAIYARLRVKTFGSLRRYAKPLRADQKIAAKVKIRPLARGLSALANGVLALLSRSPKKLPGIAMELHLGDFGEEFSKLAEHAKGQSGVSVERSSSYLNWRYHSHPSDRFETLTAREEGSLHAYVVFLVNGMNATIVDVFGSQNPVIVGSLIARAGALLRSRGISTVSAPLVEGHPLCSIFRQQGFRPRERSPIIVYPGQNSPVGQSLEQRSWLLMQGDRES